MKAQQEEKFNEDLHAGTVHTKFGKLNEAIGDLMAPCCEDLLRDASLDIGDIDASNPKFFEPFLTAMPPVSTAIIQTVL